MADKRVARDELNRSMINHPALWHYSQTRSGNHSSITVVCDDHRICTIVTSSPFVVRQWLRRIRHYHSHRLRRGKLLVGVGVQWTPPSGPGRQNPPPATLQMCVGRHCLVIQLSHAPRVPIALRRFLSDPNITFVGVRNSRDNRLLRCCSEHELSIENLVDAVDLASERKGYGKVIGMEKLAEMELGMVGVRKNPRVGRSDWDALWLSDEQVKYACADAFVSFMLGKSLRAWNSNPNRNFVGFCGVLQMVSDDDEDEEGDDSDDLY